MKKRCTKCKVEKELEEFHKHKNCKFGRNNWCKECCKKYCQTEQGKLSRNKAHKKHYQNNKEKLAKQKREYFQNNKEKLAKQHKKYRQENKEKIKEYFQNNKEKIKIKNRKYRQENKEKIRIKHRKYYQTEQGKLVKHKAYSKRRSLLKKHLNTLTLQDWNQILKSQNYKCAMCGKSFKKVKPTKDHILPISKGGYTTKENIQALCKSCNSKKGAKIL